MSYQSPLHLLDSLQIQPDQLNPAGLIQIRKKLLAEFNLTAAITISVGDKQYTKDEALKAIDQLKEVQYLNDHAVIFQDKSLLAWLEHPTTAAFPAQSISKLRWSGQQNPFFDEILAEALETYCSFLLKHRQFSMIKEPLSVAMSLPVQWQYGVQEIIYKQIKDITALIDEAQKRPDHKQDREIFGFIVYGNWADLLNSLPEESFWRIINDYCVAAVNYTVVVQHNQRHFVYEITHQLVRINCDSGLKTTIQNNYQIYKENYHTKTKSKNKNWSSWWFWALIVLAQALARSCDN
ncbi:hypothetical protein GO755_34355 [Spirosoma sp. HMF4905]|uniref:Uncharacterized protein n=1 Tax=Spirosoma arboris TaxID=2682092 RepID=A0A7K1SN18_9BACT|nr:hypothetical protein [Spirosoma arboris]MVM35157.1 hypothetical protein [Spirosoma arboris]